MGLTRRRVLRTVGVATAGELAGCLTDDEGTGEDRNDSQRSGDPPGELPERECSPSGDNRDPLYLCANTASEPSLTFQQVETNGPVLAEEGLEWDPSSFDPQFYATLLTDTADLDRIFRDRNTPAIELIEETAFATEAVLVAQIGWLSPDVTPHLERIESTGHGVHAFGCYRRPCEQRDQLGEQTVVARFQRPETLDMATVTLVRDTENRITFRSTQSVVTVEK